MCAYYNVRVQAHISTIIVSSKDAGARKNARILAGSRVRATCRVKGPIELHIKFKRGAPERVYGNARVKEPLL